MSEIKLTIDGTDYELEPFTKYQYNGRQAYGYGNPIIWLSGNQFVGKAIPKEIHKPDWQILSFGGVLCKESWDLIDGRYLKSTTKKAFDFDYLMDYVNAHQLYIHSVQREMDAEIFSVNDVTNYGIIERFYIGEDNWMNVHFTDGNGATLNSISHKPKVPLFTTEDGVEIFEGDNFIYFNEFNWTYCQRVAPKEIYPNKYPFRYFSTIEKTKEYILQNKPIEVSYNDIIKYMENRYAYQDSCYENDVIKDFFKEKINP